jgi:regulator of RNase E activity RraB
MELFYFLYPVRGYKQFVLESDFIINRNLQIEIAPHVLDLVHSLNDDAEEQELKIEFFFYSNKLENAKRLADELGKMNYSVEYGSSPGDQNKICITGWTTKMKMTGEVLEQWTKLMCDIGYKCDCEFDGWGTFPDQE